VNLPYVGIEGYSQAADAQIFQGCKMDPNLPYGILLARIGDGPAFTMPPGRSFGAPGSGPVFLRIHDADRCLVDNDGSVTVGLSSTPRTWRRRGTSLHWFPMGGRGVT
jgi:hypothetical protein